LSATTVAFGLATLDAGGALHFNLHAGQSRAHLSKKRIILVLAGTQSGKTTYGPLWLHREIQECGPGDYMIVAPSLTLMNLKAKPAFEELFINLLKLGKTRKENNRDIFYFSEEGARRTFGTYDPHAPTRVLFGYASKPDTLEAATLKGIWGDEAGQDDFRAGAHEALRRRASIARARFLYSTTPYNLGWLKTELYDRWEAGDPDIDVIRFDSTENPAFPKEEYEERARTMPRWRFNMMYRGMFERPAGLIYDCWLPALHVTPASFVPDPTWPRLIGVDFGLRNFAGLIFAKDPTNGRYYLYEEYVPDEDHQGGFQMREHVKNILAHVPTNEHGNLVRHRAIGGAFSEDSWRTEVTRAGLPVERPDQREVEVGITRVYGAIKRGELHVHPRCKNFLDEIGKYSRKLDPDTNEPTEEIDNKSTYHLLDCLRYAVGTSVKHVETARNVRAKRRVRFN
jgi:hypothetical protein